jgi:hypothetical protein
MLTCLAYCLDKELWKAIEYLKGQVRVLKEQQEKDKRILLSNQQRIRLAAKAKRLTRELLEQITVLFTPETILSWWRRLIAQKYDGRQNCKNPGRPKIPQEIIDLMIRFNPEDTAACAFTVKSQERTNVRRDRFNIIASIAFILSPRSFAHRNADVHPALCPSP